MGIIQTRNWKENHSIPEQLSLEVVSSQLEMLVGVETDLLLTAKTTGDWPVSVASEVQEIIIVESQHGLVPVWKGP